MEEGFAYFVFAEFSSYGVVCDGAEIGWFGGGSGIGDYLMYVVV